MPTYGYRCQACQREFDAWQKMTDPPQAACPLCGGAGKRLFFPAGIVFKGTGFYATDSRAASSATTSNGSSGKSSSSKDKQSSSGSTSGETASTASSSE